MCVCVYFVKFTLFLLTIKSFCSCELLLLLLPLLEFRSVVLSFRSEILVFVTLLPAAVVVVGGL